MDPIRVTDDEIVVDSMILASRGEKENPALPSFGRNLVPYFCPNRSENPTEDDINIATNLDDFRREGASILDIPMPESSKEPIKRGPSAANAGPLEDFSQNEKKAAGFGPEPLKMRKKGARSRQRAGSRKSEEVFSPTSPLDDPPVLTTSSDSDTTDSDSQQTSRTVFTGQGPTWQQEELQKSPLKAKKRAPKSQSKGPSAALSGAPKGSVKNGQIAVSTKGPLPSALLKARQDSPQVSVDTRSQLPERFAGAAFHNSPAPSCLPLPTFALQKVQDSSAPARLNLFSSPPREPRAPPPPHAGLLTPPRAPAAQKLLTPNGVTLLRAPSTPEQLLAATRRDAPQVSAEQATLALQELLKLGTPPLPMPPAPAPVEMAESMIATQNLRRLLQLA